MRRPAGYEPKGVCEGSQFKKGPKMKKNNKSALAKEVAIFVMPLLILYFIFFILPLFMGTYYSLFN